MKAQAQIQTQDTIINGVNVTKLGETIHEVRKDPNIADFKFRAKNKWEDGGYNKITIKDFFGAKENIYHKQTFHLEADEPDILLGTDKSANPVEILLASLSACMTTTLAYYSAAEGWNLESIQSEYEGDIDLQGFLGVREDVNKGYNEIRVKFKVKGDTPKEKVEEFVKSSPVFDTLNRPVQIKIEVEKE